jgi:hypothetical protein
LKEADVHRNLWEKINAKADADFKADVENLWMTLKERLLEVVEKVCGRTKCPPRHRESRWWNEEIAKLRDEKSRWFKTWKKPKNEEDSLILHS